MILEFYVRTKIRPFKTEEGSGIAPPMWPIQRKGGSTSAATGVKPKRKGGLTAAGGKSLSDMMKARWAARKRRGAPNQRR